MFGKSKYKKNKKQSSEGHDSFYDVDHNGSGNMNVPIVLDDAEPEQSFPQAPTHAVVQAVVIQSNSRTAAPVAVTAVHPTNNGSEVDSSFYRLSVNSGASGNSPP